MELRRLTVKETKRPNLITVLLVIKLHLGLVFWFLVLFVGSGFFFQEELMKTETHIRVLEKAKHLNGNSEQGLFHILVKTRMSYFRLLWSFSDCKGKENALDVEPGEFWRYGLRAAARHRNV